MEKRNKWDIVGHVKDYMAERKYNKDWNNDISYLSSLPDDKKEKYIDKYRINGYGESKDLYELLKDTSNEMKEKYIEYIRDSRYKTMLLQTMPIQMQEKYISKVLDTDEGIEMLSQMPENIILDNIDKVNANTQYDLIKNISTHTLLVHIDKLQDNVKTNILQNVDNETLVRYLPLIVDDREKVNLLQNRDDETLSSCFQYIDSDYSKAQLLRDRPVELIINNIKDIDNDHYKVELLSDKDDETISLCFQYIDNDYSKVKLLRDRSEELISNNIKYIDSDLHKAELLENASDDLLKVGIQYINSTLRKLELLQDKPQELINEIISKTTDEKTKFYLLKEQPNDLIEKYINDITDENNLYILLNALMENGGNIDIVAENVSRITNENYLYDMLTKLSEDNDITELILANIDKINDEYTRYELINQLPSEYTLDYIEGINDKNRKKELIEKVQSDLGEKYNVLQILNQVSKGIVDENEIEGLFFNNSIDKDENKLKLILTMPQEKRERFIWTLKNDEDRMAIINTLDENSTAKYIKYVRDYEKKLELANKLPKKEKEKQLIEIEEYKQLLQKLESTDVYDFFYKLPMDKHIQFIDYMPSLSYVNYVMRELPIEERANYIYAHSDLNKYPSMILELLPLSEKEYYFQYLNHGYDKCHLLLSMPEDKREEYISKLNNDADKFTILKSLNPLVWHKHIEDIQYTGGLIELLSNIEDDDTLAKVMFEQIKLSCRQYFGFGIERADFVKEHINKFMDIEGADIDAEYAKQLLEQMYEKNDEIYSKIDFRMLERKYVDILGIDKLNQVSCYPSIQQSILQLSENELNVFTKSLNSITNQSYEADWNKIVSNILNNLHSVEYKTLIENIKDDSTIDVDKLTKIMQSSNMFQIATKEDIENYEMIKQERTDEWIKSDDTNSKRKAILAKAFGHDERYAQNILEKYSLDLDKLPDSEMKYYVKILQELSNIDSPETYQQIYDIVTNIDFANTVEIERMLTTEYYKTYQNVLFDPQTAQEIEPGIYDAGTEFSMIMTALSPYIRNADIGTENFNYKDDWNRPKLSTPHFCCSYIRNDMMGTAPIRSICYGFNSMQEDSLVCSGSHDIYSNSDAITTESYREEYYLSHDTQIDRTVRYNEMDFRRMQNGQKVRPDYIIVFKENEEIRNLDMAKKAQEDWGGIPIVVIDKLACLYSEKEKVEQLKEEFNQATTEQEKQDIAIEIVQKVRNNRETFYGFANDIDFSNIVDVEIDKIITLINMQLPPHSSNTTHTIDFGEIKTHIKTDIEKSKDENKVEEKNEEEISLVGIEDFEKCDEKVNAQERLEMQELFIEIMRIKEKEENMQSKEVEYDER